HVPVCGRHTRFCFHRPAPGQGATVPDQACQASQGQGQGSQGESPAGKGQIAPERRQAQGGHPPPPEDYHPFPENQGSPGSAGSGSGSCRKRRSHYPQVHRNSLPVRLGISGSVVRATSARSCRKVPAIATASPVCRPFCPFGGENACRGFARALGSYLPGSYVRVVAVLFSPRSCRCNPLVSDWPFLLPSPWVFILSTRESAPEETSGRPRNGGNVICRSPRHGSCAGAPGLGSS